MTDKAIIIKGPTQDAKSYFTGLPGTLDELVQKATKLFPVPPGHTPHLLLSNDAILMPDVLPFLKEREVLTFKWTANTPRSSLKQTSRTTEELLQQVNSSGSSSSGSYDRASRGVRWDASVVAKEISDSTPTIVPARQYRYSATARAEHSRRVLNEQEQEKKRVAATNSTKEGKTFANDDPFKVTSKNQDDPNTSPQTIQHEEKQNTTNEITKSKIQISSPSMERERIQSDEEQPNSSPIASPTRNIRNAQKSSKEWMTPLGSDKCEEKLMKIGESKNGMSDKQVEETPKLQTQTNTPPTQNFVANSTSDNETSPSSQESPRTQAYYQQMTSIIDSLRSHPSNQFFRQSLEFDPKYSQYIQFLRENNRPVIDFHILGQKLQRRQYGQENVYAAFASDLLQMWSGIRAFFGPGSAHAQCAEFLERFSKIFMVEWRREGQVEDSRGRVKSTQKQSDSIVNPNAKAEAMARAAKLLQNMTYGSGANNNKTAMPQLKRKVSDSKMMTNNNAVQNRPRPIAGRPMINGQQKTQTSPLRNVKASAITMNASEKSFTPRTNAFLDSMFPKSNEVQNNTAPTDMMNKFSQAFKSNQGEIDSQRNSNSPKSSPKNKKEVKQTLSTALKRTEPESQLSQAEERPSKRIHADSNAQNVIVESNQVVPTVLVTEENQDADKMVVDVKTATLPVEKEEENAIEEVTKVIPSKTKGKRNLTSPNSGSAKKKNSQIIQQTRSSPRHTTIENIKESSEPRRSSRQSTPTTKVRNEEGIQTPNTQSPTNSTQEKSTPSRTRSRKSKSPTSSAEKQQGQQSQRKTSRASLLASMTNKPVTRQRRISANV